MARAGCMSCWWRTMPRDRAKDPPDATVWADYVRAVRPLPGREHPEPNSLSAPGGGEGRGEVGTARAHGFRSRSGRREHPVASGDDLAVVPPPLPGPLRPQGRRGGERDTATPVAPLAIGKPPAGVDAASWNRLRTGRLAPERTLDLHGRTAHAAYDALTAFLHRAQADRVRCVEIITGRGEGAAGGVIRRELPLWLNLDALRPLVLGAAYPHPANSGAVRLLLRRPR